MKASAKKNKKSVRAAKKKINKWFVFIPSALVVLAVVITGIVFFVPRDNTSFSYECFRLRLAVSGFLGNLIDGDHASAAEAVQFRAAESGEVLESTEALRSLWARRVEDLRKGVRNHHLADYSELSVRKEQGAMIVTVLLDVQLQGQADTFSKDPYTLTVVETEDGWKIATLTENSVLTDFERAVSGLISAEELEGGAL